MSKVRKTGRIEIISASAGSGKTYRLAQRLEQEIGSGKVRPEAVLATTFTRKAAAELQERVRVRLLANGQVEQAQRLAAARIGTVNSVCGRLVTDFAFELGLSPELRVLDEAMAPLALKRALATVLSTDEEQELAEIADRMVDFKWQARVQEMVDLARANRIEAKELRACAGRSCREFLQLFGKEANDERTLDVALAKAVDGFLTTVRGNGDTTKATANAVNDAENAARRLHAGMQLPWKDWVKLAKLSAAKASDKAAEKIRIAAGAQDTHPRLHRDIRRAIELVFELSARTVEAYQRHKRELGVIDFVDQENLALRLLEQPEVARELAEDLDLVLVDEFQDTSPIQLAIFLKLSEIAGKSVWVGDQKQAIFGFRGTDPALMDAAIEAILAGEEPETLPKSYRSRPELVNFTSDLFAPAFACTGIPEQRVRLKPAKTDEPKGLGVVLECWPLTAKNKPEEIAALAAAVRDLLKDKVQIRDPDTKEARKLRPGDVAVLCRMNVTCTSLAAELALLGIRAVLPRMGLMKTVEARLVLAGLKLWVDARDSLAAAELARLVEFAGREDQWFASILQKPGSEAFAEARLVRAVQTAREAQPKFGTLAAFDAVVDALGARDLCRRWGDAPARLANLEALRGHAVNYAQSCATEGAGCTPAGLVSHLVELADGDADSQGVGVDDQAVVISTWHKAKGLEWPVTVLFELQQRDRDALGVKIISDRPKITLADPLGGRWLRFWLNPYDPRNTGMPFHDRLAEHPATAAAEEQSDRENLRLLYVGWTRARDRVALAGRTGKITDSVLQLLEGPKGLLVDEPGDEEICWAGRTVKIQSRPAEMADPEQVKPKPADGYAADGPKAHPAAYLQPSESEEFGKAPERVERIGERMILSGKPDWANLGSAVHGFLCADRPQMPAKFRLEMAGEILGRWGVLSAIRPEDLVSSSDALRKWIDGRWPEAAWQREWPIFHRMEDGAIVRGICDLVLRLPKGFVLLDHKSFPGTIEQAVVRAAKYAGQVKAYGRALAAAMQLPLLATFIHMPVSGIVLPIE